MAARAFLSLLLVAGGASPLLAAASEWVVNGPSRVRLVTPYAVAPAEGELRLGLEVRLAPGWHSYWKNSGDAGYPPTLTLEPGGSVSDLELLYPVPRRFDLPGGLVAFGYEDEVVYPLTVRVAAPRAREVRLAADVDYVVCAEECIPYRAALALAQPVAAAAVEDPATAPLVARWWARLPRPVEAVPGVATDAALVAGDGGAPELEVRVSGVEPRAEGAQLFFAPHGLFDLGRPAPRSLPGGVVFRVPLAPRRADRALPPRIAFEWTAAGVVRGGRRLAIEARREVASTPHESAATAAGADRAGALGRTTTLPAFAAAAAAVAATLLALHFWGVLGRDAAPGAGWRRPLGFAAAGGTIWALLALAHTTRREALVLVELALLGLALCAWLRRRAARGMLFAALTVGLLACAAAAVWLAHRGQL